MMKRLILVLTILLLPAAVAQAQGAQFAWTASPNATTAAEAQGLIHTIYVNAAATGVVLTGVTCTGTAPAIACLANVPTSIPLTIGTRYEIAAKTATSAESPRSVPFIKAPDAPTNLRTQ